MTMTVDDRAIEATLFIAGSQFGFIWNTNCDRERVACCFASEGMICCTPPHEQACARQKYQPKQS